VSGEARIAQYTAERIPPRLGQLLNAS